MKRIIYCLLLLAVTNSAAAQTFRGQMLLGKSMKATAEVEINKEKLYTYSYLETSEGIYWLQQIIEVSFYKNWSAHLEYRTGDIFMAGVARTIVAGDWIISVCALGRCEIKKFTGQIGAVWQYRKDKIDIYGYADFWWDRKFQTFAEQRFFYEVAEGFAIGAVVNLSNSPKWEVIPYIGMCVKL